MSGNVVLADLECDIGVIGTSSRSSIDPTVLITVISSIILVSLVHQQY